jgi:hypothetical protein
VDEELDRAPGTLVRTPDRLHGPPARPLERALGRDDGCAQLDCLDRRRGQPELEHRLHKRDQLRLRTDLEWLELRSRVGDREVGEVDRDHVHGLGGERPVEVAEVDALEIDDASVVSQRAEQLAVAGVDGVDARGSRCE